MGIQVDVLTLVLTTCITGAVGWLVKAVLDQLKEYRAESKAWREGLDERVDAMNDSLICVMRGDLIHKAHRYVDDKGYASIEEKESWHEEWTQYQSICPRNGFIDALAEQVMALPEHEQKTS